MHDGGTVLVLHLLLGVYQSDAPLYFIVNNEIQKNRKRYFMNKEIETLAAESAMNIKTLDDVIATMDSIQKEMLWNKVCENSLKLDRLEEKVNRILEILGDK